MYLVNILNALNPNQAIESCLGQISKRVGITFHPAGVSSFKNRFGACVYFLGPVEGIATMGVFQLLTDTGGPQMVHIFCAPRELY